MVAIRKFFARLFGLDKDFHVYSNKLRAKPGQTYTIYEGRDGGMYGGILSLDDLRAGEGIEVSIYINIDNKFVRTTYIQADHSEVEHAPLLVLDEMYAPKGIRITLTQTAGFNRDYTYYVYRK